MDLLRPVELLVDMLSRGAPCPITHLFYYLLQYYSCRIESIDVGYILNRQVFFLVSDSGLRFQFNWSVGCAGLALGSICLFTIETPKGNIAIVVSCAWTKASEWVNSLFDQCFL